jgi:hypothetical protein
MFLGAEHSGADHSLDAEHKSAEHSIGAEHDSGAEQGVSAALACNLGQVVMMPVVEHSNTNIKHCFYSFL